ncbi:MAG: imidazole glycerol phosphate synthase subunit HisH [Hyphomicrobiales bacterium]
MISIVDYGLSNLACVASACAYLGYEARIVETGDGLEGSERIILPGVGAFGDAMRNLGERGLIPALNKSVVEDRVPFLGICLGAQLICRDSDEFGMHEGLGWLDVPVRRVDTLGEKLRVPHTGWDNIEILRESPLLDGIPPDSLFYFTHSHAAYPAGEDSVVATCAYGRPLAAVLQERNIFATQFHPEKSQKIGLELLSNFLKLPRDAV